MFMIRNFIVTLLCILLFVISNGYGQAGYKTISLPAKINGVNEEYSGMAIWKNRAYIEPQYGSNKDTKLDGDFFIYSIRCDSISRVIDGRDAGLTAYRTLRVNNLNKLPDSIKKFYEGFEAITIVNGKIFLTVETDDACDYCFILKGSLDTANNEIKIDPVHFATLKRYPYIVNAGFESVTYLPKENKLLAVYEFNSNINGGTAFLLDTAFKKPAQKIQVPFVYFRITDITATTAGKIYGINSYWNGDYNSYLNNNIIRHQEENIKRAIPDLTYNMQNDTAYLKGKTTCYVRIVSLNTYKDKHWKQVATFECEKNNWEGIALFRKGALVISDANRSSKQVTTLAYISF